MVLRLKKSLSREIWRESDCVTLSLSTVQATNNPKNYAQLYLKKKYPTDRQRETFFFTLQIFGYIVVVFRIVKCAYNVPTSERSNNRLKITNIIVFLFTIKIPWSEDLLNIELPTHHCRQLRAWLKVRRSCGRGKLSTRSEAGKQLNERTNENWQQWQRRKQQKQQQTERLTAKVYCCIYVGV